MPHMVRRPAQAGALAFWIAALAGSALAGPDPALELGYDPMCGCGKCGVHRALGEDRPTTSYSNREALNATNLLTVDLDIEVDFATGNVFGFNTMRVRSNVAGLTQFTFMLRSQFLVQRNLSGNAADTNRVTLNGVTPAVVSTPPANSYARTVTLDRAYNVGEEFTVTIHYSGVPVSRGFGSIDIGTQNGANIISTLSEPYYAATWWPVKDGDVFAVGDNSDKSTGSLALTVPDGLRVVANGLLTSETVPAPGKRKFRWTTNYPTATYLYLLSATNYNQWSVNYSYPLPGGGTGSMPVQFSIYPTSDTPTNRAAWQQVVQMLATFRGVYGEYPFINEKYGIYQFPFGGGMEHQTYTGQGGFGESLSAHELAHQWWGDNVTCKQWNDIWLNEGSATYSEAIWAERKPGSTGLPALFSAMAARRPGTVNDSVYVYDVSNLNRIFSGTYTYNKGAWVMHQLRHIVGDTTFFSILAAHRAAHQGSGATTADFAAVASSVAGTDLTWFFTQCVMGIGAPAYSYGWQTASINGQNYLRLSITQTQDATWPGAGAPAGFFRFPIDVRVTTPSGNTTYVVDNAARSQHFVIPINGPASNVVLDEFDWILNTGKTNAGYTPGPAKVVDAAPLPGKNIAVAPASLTVTFSENVSTNASHYALVGPSGSVATTFAYSAPTFTTTLTPLGTLAPGAYTLTVSPSVTSVAAGANLDGEIVNASLPSGDGLAGGAAVITFTIDAPPGCDPDVNQDGNVDQGDVDYLVNVIGGGSNPSGVDPDFNADGNVDQGDVDALLNVVAGGACP